MSRIGRLPVEIPGGVQVDVNGSSVRVKGPKGELQRVFSSLIGIKIFPQLKKQDGLNQSLKYDIYLGVLH